MIQLASCRCANIVTTFSCSRDTVLVAVRPYRYAYTQKTKLEHQCVKMLQSTIIRPSSSAFSAPILLIKKHDDSWCFCINYQTLNDRTVKDKFPIPVVEDLLNELHDSRFFTKLDPCSVYHQVQMHTDDILHT
jgi:hypothetical protein